MKADLTRAFLAGVALWLLVPGAALALPMAPPGGIALQGPALTGPLVMVTAEDEATSEEGSVGDPASVRSPAITRSTTSAWRPRKWSKPKVDLSRGSSASADMVGR